VATGTIMRMLRPDDVVLEVGANIGYYALLEARLCRRIYAVEPHPDNFRRLNENVALNGYDNIETFNLAFGATAGSIPMRCSELSNWHSCRDAAPGDDGTIAVTCTRIDDFVAGRPAPSFVKMDVEGFELEVLKGAEQALAAVRCVFLELHGDILSRAEIREVIDRLRAAGLAASLIVQYDRPGLSRLCPNEHIARIHAGDRGTYELFFTRP
jgi:FkbM family methyltransferase